MRLERGPADAAYLRGALAYFIHVGLQLGIVIDAAELLQQHRMHFLGLLDLAGFALEHQIGTSGHRIGSAAAQHERTGGQGNEQRGTKRLIERHGSFPATAGGHCTL